jgi:hypothetical protein
MASADHYRKQAQVFARMAASSAGQKAAERYRSLALEYLANAEKLEPSVGFLRLVPSDGNDTDGAE